MKPNKPKFIVAWDVDLTFYPTDNLWLTWLNSVCGTSRTIEDCQYDYQTGYHFPEFAELEVKAMDFWRNPTLYDTIRPVEGAIEAAEMIVDAGGAISWNSYCKAGHFGSKVRAIKRDTPFAPLGGMHSFFATKEKGGIICDFAIDDRYHHLSQYNDRVVKIHYDTPWKEEFICPVDLKSNNYKEIAEFIIDLV